MRSQRRRPSARDSPSQPLSGGERAAKSTLRSEQDRAAYWNPPPQPRDQGARAYAKVREVWGAEAADILFRLLLRTEWDDAD